MPAVGFAANKMNRRTVSAPYNSIISSGDTVLPSDLLILADLILSESLHCGHGLPMWSTLSVIPHDSHQGAALFTIP